MQPGKPGRVLWWVSMFSWAIGWLYAAITSNLYRDGNFALAALLFWALGAFTGALWLIIKMWAILCRVRAQSIAVQPIAAARSRELDARNSRLTGREVFTGVAIGLAFCGLLYLGHLILAVAHPTSQADSDLRSGLKAGIVQDRRPEKKEIRHKRTAPQPDKADPQAVRAWANVLASGLCQQPEVTIGSDGRCYKTKQQPTPNNQGPPDPKPQNDIQ